MKPERRVVSSIMQPSLLQRNGASSTLAHVQKALEATADQETNVDEDGNEDGGSYGSSVFGVINAADELLVAVLVDESKDR